jgi:hypothetical protein
LALLAVDFIVAVAVKQHQVRVPVVQPIPIPVMYLDHVLYREVQPTKPTTILLPL